MAHLRLETGDYPEAERLFRKTMAQQQQQLGQDHEETLTTGHRLAQALANQGQLAAAKTLCRSIVERSRQVLGQDHPASLAASMDLVRVLGCQLQHADVVAACDDILPRLKMVHGAEDPAAAECAIWRVFAEGVAALPGLEDAARCKAGEPADTSGSQPDSIVTIILTMAIESFRKQRQGSKLPPPLRATMDAELMRTQVGVVSLVLTVDMTKLAL